MSTSARFEDMSVDAVQRLILCTSRSVEIAAEVLDLDLNVVGDLTDRLVTSGSSVQWTGSATVHRGCTVTLALAPDGSDFDFGLNLLRLKYTLIDTVAAGSGWAYLGAFMLQKPDFTSGTEVVDDTGQFVGRVSCQVNGQDVTASLDRQIGYSYVADVGASVLQRVSELATAAGFSSTTVLLESTNSDTPMGVASVWPLIAVDTASTDDTTVQQPIVLPPDAPNANSGPTTWRVAWNDLAALIGYRAVWANNDGLLRGTPNVDPLARGSQFPWNAISPTVTLPNGHQVPAVAPTGPETTRSVSVTAFNQFTFIWSNMGETASLENGGVLTLSNDADGPSSVTARGGVPRGVSPTQVQITAASLADFTAQANAQFNAVKRSVTTYMVKTVPYPPAGHYDVFTYLDEQVTGPDGVKVQAASWTLPLDGGLMDWTWMGVA